MIDRVAWNYSFFLVAVKVMQSDRMYIRWVTHIYAQDRICIAWIKMWKYCFLGLIVGCALTGTLIHGQDDQLGVQIWIFEKSSFFRSFIDDFVADASLSLSSFVSEFISIDCGIADGSLYIDPITGIIYSSDAGFVDSGANKSISVTFQNNSLERQF